MPHLTVSLLFLKDIIMIKPEDVPNVETYGKGISNYIPTHVIVATIPEHQKCPSGTIVITPSGETSMTHIVNNDIPKEVTSYRIVKIEDIPKDEYFRDAWKHENGNITVHMEKALSIHQ